MFLSRAVTLSMNNWLSMRHLDLVFDWVYCETFSRIFHINTLFDPWISYPFMPNLQMIFEKNSRGMDGSKIKTYLLSLLRLDDELLVDEPGLSVVTGLLDLEHWAQSLLMVWGHTGGHWSLELITEIMNDARNTGTTSTKHWHQQQQAWVKESDWVSWCLVSVVSQCLLLNTTLITV